MLVVIDEGLQLLLPVAADSGQCEAGGANASTDRVLESAIAAARATLEKRRPPVERRLGDTMVLM